MKKKLLSLGLTCLLAISMAVPVFAESQIVYYKGTPVEWQYGRNLALSYSHTFSSNYEHCTTANWNRSPWMPPCCWARAQCHVGFQTAKAYWDCRG